MKKLILIISIILAATFFYFSILWVWSATIKKWKYIVEKWATVASLPKAFNLQISPTYLKLYLRLSWTKSDIKAWSFTINDDMTFQEFLIKKASKPDWLDREITILPWWNIFDIDEMLAYKSVIKPGELITLSKNISPALTSKYPFLKWHSLEGFIYPDTYRVALDAKLEDILKVTLDEFVKKIYTSNKWSDFYDNLIMSSIVEKEERDPLNKPIVAWILLKRLKENIAIWADATVCYQYEITSSNCTSQFIWEKIYIKSKYNTRERAWLPPTPISNMSADTFDAVANPKSSQYYYYLHDLKWNIHYASSLKEHNNNKFKYLR